MNLKFFLLGLLTVRSASGYTLHKKFFTPWKPAISQIYRTLSEMEEDGLVTSSKVFAEKLPSQNIFQTTDAGRTALRRWLKQPQKERLTRHRVLEQMWFGNQTSKEHIINDIHVYAEYARELLNYYENDAKPRIEKHAKITNDPLETLYHELACDYAVRECKLSLDWADIAIQRITNSPAKAPIRKSTSKRKNPVDLHK